MRSRSWRRWRSEVKLEKVKLHRHQLTLNQWKKYYTDRRYNLSYSKKNSITEVIEVEVVSLSHFNDYLHLRSRQLRDNPKKCSCWYCCNPRKAYSNSKHSLSLSELRFFESLNYQRKYDD